MKKYLYPIPFVIVAAFIAGYFLLKKSNSPASKMDQYCGSCHLVPSPENLPKSIWQNHVLPDMAARLGIKYNNYNPYSKNNMTENLLIRLNNIYPETPLMDSTAWQQVSSYILEMAPDSIYVDSLRAFRNSSLHQFNPTLISLNESRSGTITNLEYQEFNHQLTIGDAAGKLYGWHNSPPTDRIFHSPIISHTQTPEALYLTEVGFLNPSEGKSGVIYKINGTALDTLATKLQRPVYSKIADLNNDGIMEILLCEFGNNTGQFSMLEQQESGYEKRTLLPYPGSIKVELADMNQDGMLDIILLASQGQEGIYIFYQKANLQFNIQQAIKMGPEYGSSWFELVDFNEDGFHDIILANGDNADFSNILKPFHGIRIFINDGSNHFEEKWFYPIYGATRLSVKDFDQDGDLDIAVLAYFPDFNHSPEEGFVYLENIDPGHYEFQSYTTPEAMKSRWLVMEDGDFDQDGDIDLMLGAFILPMDKEFVAIQDLWRDNKVDLMFLENQFK